MSSRLHIIWLVMLCFLALLISAYAFGYYWIYPPEHSQAIKYSRMVPWLVYGHFVFGGSALLTGCFQLWTKRPSLVHSVLGYSYCCCVLISSICVFYLTYIAGMSWSTLGFLSLDIFWLISTGYAVSRAIKGDIETHRRWILRSLTCTCAAITLRLMLPVLTLFLSFETSYIIVAWFSGIANLIAFEIYLYISRTSSVAKTLPTKGILNL
ncbi:MAG: DUF2306 domain-containing protein [Gammaproteobacteria bacterium]|nr:MAG: DUF2306 domain-containing protein [Gammaproteobacteria bacterium]